MINEVINIQRPVILRLVQLECYSHDQDYSAIEQTTLLRSAGVTKNRPCHTLLRYNYPQFLCGFAAKQAVLRALQPEQLFDLVANTAQQLAVNILAKLHLKIEIAA